MDKVGHLSPGPERAVGFGAALGWVNTREAATAPSASQRMLWSVEPRGSQERLGILFTRNNVISKNSKACTCPALGQASLCGQKSFWTFSQGRGLANFFCKNKIVNILGFASHTVSVATTRFSTEV